MHKSRYWKAIWYSLLITLTVACHQDSQWKGQAPIQKVSTTTVPIQKQLKGTFDLGNGIYTSNDFEGARLNGIVLTNDTLITALITPENTPINDSPWYAFKIWSEKQQNISVRLTYLEGVKHRYYPKLSHDGLLWSPLDTVDYSEDMVMDEMGEKNLPTSITMQLAISPDTLWVAAQELITSQHVHHWITRLDTLPFVSSSEIGVSGEGRALEMLRIGNSDDQKMIVVIARLHPPEVTGYLAMKAFVESLCDMSDMAVQFREQYNTYVIPLANPDGVANGHWRHNAGGIDLNRDWEFYHQPENAAFDRFFKNKVSTSGGKLYFSVDFHSTYEDIYYTIDPELEGNMPGLVPRMIEATGEELAGYEPNVRPRKNDAARVTSLDYFFHVYGAESLVYEIGDNTPRDLLRRKGEISAMKMMELMLE